MVGFYLVMLFLVGCNAPKATSTPIPPSQTPIPATSAPDGKPVEFSQELPAITKQIKYSVDGMDLKTSNGQALYFLRGWSFISEDPNQSTYERLIVLQSDTKTYFFPSERYNRPGVQETYKALNMDLLNSGFHTYISPDVIEPGTYHIGILFINQSSNALYYKVTNKMITRTDHQLQLGLQP